MRIETKTICLATVGTATGGRYCQRCTAVGTATCSGRYSQRCTVPPTKCATDLKRTVPNESSSS